jgi:hypothetical protein
MVSVDARTRRRSDVRALSAEEVVTELLPKLVAAHGTIAAAGVRALGTGPLVVRVGDQRFSVTTAGDALVVSTGAHDGGLAVSMDEDALSDVLQDLSSLAWANMMGRLRIDDGSLEDLARWDPIVRALRDGEPAYAPGLPEVRDRHGSPLDLQHGFRLDDDPDDIGHFLAQAGYLHLRGVFTADEMAAVSSELDAAIDDAERDDGQSWWARTANGWYPARILGFNRKSATLRELLRSPRFLALTSFVADDFVQGDVGGSDMAEGLLKKVGVVEGISDVSWHKDCGPGGHSYGCSGLTVGIQVTGADRRSGELGVMAASNRANIPGLHIADDFGLPRVSLPTEVGDCTIHCSCTMHMSRPPEAAERRVVYTGFSLAPLPEEARLGPSEEVRREYRAALDGLGRGTEGRPAFDRLTLPG